MALSIRTKEVLVVTLLATVVVSLTTLVHLSTLTKVIIRDAMEKGNLLAAQVYAQSNQALTRMKRGKDLAETLQADADLRALLQTVVGYSSHTVYAMLTDTEGRVILHSEPSKEGLLIPPRPRMEEILGDNAYRRFRAVYEPGQVFEVALPLKIGEAPFGVIRLGLSTTLLRQELQAALTRSVVLAGLALVVAWGVGLALARVVLKPLRRISQQVESLARGESSLPLALPTGDEVGEMAAKLNLLGQQIQQDRSQLLSEKTQLERMVNSLEDSLLFLNRSGEVLFLNPAAEALLEVSSENAVGRPLGEVLPGYQFLPPLVSRASATGRVIKDITLSSPEESRPDLRASVFPLLDPTGTAGAIVMLRNMEPLRALGSLLNYSAKLAVLGQITSGVAHEVKNPLNAMMIHLEILRSKIGRDSPDLHRNVEVLVNEVKRLDRVVQGFLHFMRPRELHLAPVDANALLDEVITLIEAEGAREGVRFVTQFSPTLPSITGDAELLRQAFLNVVLNACQAMPRGGTVTLSSARLPEGVVEVRISDEGMGIPPEEREKIFKLYYTTKPNGSGIGLSLVYRILQLHDGAIGVESDVGKGTTMILTLPLR